MLVDSIFFDLDGTLVDSTGDIANAVNHALRAFKLKELPRELVASYIGTGSRDLITKSLGAANSNLVDRAVDIFSEYYMAHPAVESVLYPHTEDILKYFKDKKKYILTNRYKKIADTTLSALGIRRYFEEIFGGDDENCLKPSTCVLDPVILKLRIDRSKALMVGDMAIDIMTGKNSGIKSCWIRHGLGRSEDVEPLKPDLVIDDLIELKSIIE